MVLWDDLKVKTALPLGDLLHLAEMRKLDDTIWLGVGLSGVFGGVVRESLKAGVKDGKALLPVLREQVGPLGVISPNLPEDSRHVQVLEHSKVEEELEFVIRLGSRVQEVGPELVPLNGPVSVLVKCLHNELDLRLDRLPPQLLKDETEFRGGDAATAVLVTGRKGGLEQILALALNDRVVLDQGGNLVADLDTKLPGLHGEIVLKAG